MRTYISWKYLARVTLALVAGVIAIPRTSFGASEQAGPHHVFLGGPWELLVQRGFENEGMRFPLSVSDEAKPQKLNAVLPVMGTSIKIKLDQYLPDLKWETKAVTKAGAGSVAKLVVEAKDLSQEIWLCSDDPMRRSITSSIGSVAIHYTGDAKASAKLFEQLNRPGAVGILTVWENEVDAPVDLVVCPGENVSLPKSDRKVEILEYIPHYSINTKTREVVSQSDKPVNPAIKIRFIDGQDTHETWLWSRFHSSPHSKTDLPVRVKFTDIDFRGSAGKYVLFAVRGSDSCLLTSQDGRIRLSKVETDKPYAFSQEGYSFRIEQIVHEAAVVKDWGNNSDRLMNPAFVVTVEQGENAEQVVLELNKPHHYEADDGTCVLVYRRTPAPAGHGNPADDK